MPETLRDTPVTIALPVAPTSWTQGVHGQVTRAGPQSLTYTPASGFTGTDSFTYEPGAVTVQITVRAPNVPPIVPDIFVYTQVGVPVEFQAVATDSDPVSLLSISPPSSGAIAILQGNRIRYTPAEGFAGRDTVSFTFVDPSGAQGTGTAYITVGAENRAPYATAQLTAQTIAGVPISVDLLEYFEDPDRDPISLNLLLLPQHGTFELNGTVLTYRPDAGFEGVETITYQVMDARGATTVGRLDVSVQLPVTPLIARDDTARAVSGRPITIDVLANDTGGQTIVGVTQPGSGRAVVTDAMITYTSLPDFVGTDTFQYTVRDERGTTATGTVTVTVSAPTDGYHNGYPYRRRIFVRDDVPAGFVLLVKDSDPTFRLPSNGGHLPDIGRVRFELSDGTKLPHDLAGYYETTGTIHFYVRLPVPGPVTIYMYYGLSGAPTEQMTAQTWADYLAGWHPPSFPDITGRGNDITSAPNATSFQGALVADGAYLNGSAYLSIPSAAFLSGKQSLTLQVLARNDRTVSSTQSLLKAGTALEFRQNGTDGLYGAIATSDGTVTVGTTGGVTGWKWYSLIFDRAEGLTAYIDDQPARITASTGSTITATSQIGAVELRIGEGWLGVIDEVRIRDGALPANWIALEALNVNTPRAVYGMGDEEHFSSSVTSPIATPLRGETTVGTQVWFDPPAPVVSVTQPPSGTAAIDGTRILYTPGAEGTYRFTYTVSRDGKTSSGTVSVVVRAAPAAAPTLMGFPYNPDSLAPRRPLIGQPVAKRILVDRTGWVKAIRWMPQLDSGDGGELVVKIVRDNAGLPTGTTIGTTSAGPALAEWPLEHMVWLEAGQAYHVVWYQLGTGGTTAVVLHRSSTTDPFEGTDWPVRQLVGGTWQLQPEYGGHVQLVWADGVVTGNPVVTGGYPVMVGGATMVRQRFVGSGQTIAALQVRAMKGPGSPSPLLVTLEQIDGTLIEQVSISDAPAAEPVTWITKTLSQTRTLVAGQMYAVRFSAASGTYLIKAVRAVPSRDLWTNAWAEITTDGGGSWRGWSDESGVNRTDFHLPVLFTAPPPATVTRMPVTSVIQTSGWTITDTSKIDDDAATGDGLVENRGAAQGATVWARFGFATPPSSLTGQQTFRVRMAFSTSGGNMRVELMENGTLRQSFANTAVTTSQTTYSFNWDTSAITNTTGADVELRLWLIDSLGSGPYYSIEAVDWLARHGGGGGGPPPSNWPWGPQPALGSYHGVGQAFSFSYDSQGRLVWQPLRDYDAWLGRPSNIVKVWPNMNAAASWDDIAGGSGSSDTTWSGQLNELNPNRALDPTYWPASRPVVLALTAVPSSHSNAQNSSNGQWGRPGIWAEIARGDYDTFYQRLFRRLATRCGATGRDPRTLVLRWCWEMNGNWYQHSVGPDKANFITAWRRCMDIMRSSVSAVLGAGKSFMIEFGPSGHLRFGNGASERLWNIYPGDDWVDICGLGIHDQVGITTQSHWDQYLWYPATIAGTPFEGYRNWFDFAVARGKWVGTSEIESNYVARTYFPKTQNMSVMWTTGFEPLRQQYAGKFLYFIYLWTGNSHLNRSDGWGEPYRQLYKP